MRSLAMPVAVLALMGATTSVFAVDYLTVAQAQTQLFPSAVQWSDKNVALTADQLTAVAKLGKVSARSSGWKLLLASDATGKYLGAVVVDQVVGKYELITYAVGVDAAGSIRGVEILTYRESHGSEIRLPAWRKQFVGKTTVAPLQTGNDIAVISGATLSCNHVTDGVRRITAVISVLREASMLPAST
jgi:Na+-translocating ferredoxin:NAD+ oxidoreductase RnfG subunit